MFQFFHPVLPVHQFMEGRESGSPIVRMCTLKRVRLQWAQAPHHPARIYHRPGHKHPPPSLPFHIQILSVHMLRLHALQVPRSFLKGTVTINVLHVGDLRQGLALCAHVTWTGYVQWHHRRITAEECTRLCSATETQNDWLV